MQTEKARAELKRLTSLMLAEGMTKGNTVMLRQYARELAALCGQCIDALESVKALGILKAQGVEVVMLDCDPAEAESVEWVRQNCADGKYEVEE